MTPRATRTLSAAAATLLTATALGPLFRGKAWVPGVVAAVVVATACGALGRRARLPSAVVPLLTPLGLVGVLTAVGSPGNALLGVFPSWATLASLRALVVDGFADIRDYATPVPTTPGLILIAVAGVYVVTALVDLLAVTAARPVLAGLPLLALFATPASLRRDGVGLLHFVLAVGGWLLLLGLDGRERLTRWGRVLGRQQQEGPQGFVLGGAAGRVAGVSLAAALLLPLALPPLGDGILTSSAGGIGDGEGGSVTVVAPLVTVEGRLHEEAEVDLFAVGTATPDYYRLTALDAFDGRQFTLVQDSADADRRVNGPLDSATPGLGGDVPFRSIEAQVRVGDRLVEPYLPLPYSPTEVRIEGRWQLAPNLRTVFSLRDTTRGRTFTVRSQSPEPTVEQLRAAADAWTPGADTGRDRQLATDVALPPTLLPLVRQTALQLTQGLVTDYDRMLALQTFFTGGEFAYDLTAPIAAGNDGIATFLRDRRGYCEQFASVFTLMARSLGVPARVAVGFTPGRQTAAGTWTVTNKDAHAWPEVWFDGVGWIRFEPTPRGDLGVQPGYFAGAPVPAPAPTPTATPSASTTASPSASARVRDTLPQDQPDAALPALQQARGVSGTALATLAVLAVLLALLLLPAASRTLLRRRRRGATTAAGPVAAAQAAAAAHAAWAELLDTAADLRLPLADSDSPRATGRRIAGLLPPSARPAEGLRAGTRAIELEEIGEAPPEDAARRPRRGAAPDPVAAGQALDRVTRAEERARYAPAAGPVAMPSGLAEDAVTVRRALLAGQPRGVRLRATLLPPSVLGRARERMGRAADSTSAVTGRLSAAAGDRVRGLLARG